MMTIPSQPLFALYRQVRHKMNLENLGRPLLLLVEFLKFTLTMILSPEVNTSLSVTEELLNNKLLSVDRLLSLFFLVFFDFFAGLL